MAKKSSRSFIPNTAMAAVLANKLQPGSFAGIPNEAVGDLFDRMDNAYNQGQTALSNMQEHLTKDLADASPEDRIYLQKMYDNVTNVINEASSQNDFHNRVRQIRDLARSITGNPNYMNIRNNIAKGKKQQEAYNKMVSELGAENVTFTGDFYADGFSSVGPNGEINQLNGTPTERPDYTTKMQKMFTPKLDVTDSMEDVQAFVESEGYGMWLGTQEGRIHVNDMARSMFGKPFMRLSTVQELDPITGEMISQRERVVNEIKEQLKAAGMSRVGQYGTTASRNKLSGSHSYLNSAPGPSVTGNYSTMVTDDSEGEDISIPTYYTNIENKGLEQTLINQFRADADLNFVDVGSGFASQRGSVVNANAIKEAHLTPALNPNTGEVIVQVGLQTGAESDMLGNQVGYVSVAPADFAQMGAQMLDDFMLQQKLDPGNMEARKMAYPILQSMVAPELGPYLKGIDNSRYMELPYNYLRVRNNAGKTTGVYVEREEGGTFGIKALEGQKYIRINMDGERKELRNLSERDLRNIVGSLMYQTMMP